MSHLNNLGTTFRKCEIVVTFSESGDDFRSNWISERDLLRSSSSSG